MWTMSERKEETGPTVATCQRIANAKVVDVVWSDLVLEADSNRELQVGESQTAAKKTLLSGARPKNQSFEM